MRANGVIAGFDAGRVALSSMEPAAGTDRPARPGERGDPPSPGRAGVPVTLVLAGEGGVVHPVAGGPQATRVNYLIGRDPAGWRTGVPAYGAIRYPSVYSGIDLVFYTDHEGSIEHDFVVAPGGDPSAIGLRIEGADRVELAADGSLVAGNLRLSAPRIYQEGGQGRVEIDGRMRIEGKTIAFEIGEYDSTRTLVIDPVITAYSTFYGGSGWDRVHGVAVAPDGGAVSAGYTESADLVLSAPIQPAYGGGDFDAMVTKLSPGGQWQEWSTYIGGSGIDKTNALTVDSTGDIYLAGSTTSGDFPAVGGFQGTLGGGWDAFVAKIAANGGSIIYSSYLGDAGDDRGMSVAVDATGATYLAGDTTSTAFPTVAPLQAAHGGGVYDAFVTRVDSAGSTVTYSTFIGGAADDGGAGIAVDTAGAAFMTGYTASADFPVTASIQPAYGGGVYDGFVTRLNPGGSSLAYSTYLGGTDQEGGSSIAVDSSGAAYVTGGTGSADFPVASAYQAAKAGGNDVFISKLNSAGSSLAYSTFLGASGWDEGWALALGPSGSVTVTGETSSTDFTVVQAFQASYGGAYDAFVAGLSADGSMLESSSYLGGSGYEQGWAIAADRMGVLYVGGETGSADFPLTRAAQGTYGGGARDGFVVKAGRYPIRANTDSQAGQLPAAGRRPSVSGGAKYVAFHSTATEMVPADTNGVGDVFVKDAVLGTVERVSVATGGGEGDGGSRFPAITPDGRYVVFMSDATNLAAGDANGAEDIYLRDRTLGTTERISVSTGGAGGGAGQDSRFASISADGRFVAFQTQAALDAGDTNGRWDIYVRDRTALSTTRASVTSTGGQPNSAAARASISDDGRYVVFHSWANNLVATDTNAASDVFLRDRTLGATERISVSTAGTQGSGESGFPKIAGDGGAVAFHSSAGDLVTDDINGARDTFVRDLGAGATLRVSLSTGGAEADGATGYAAISSDGRYVAFHGVATNLVPADSNGQQDVFVRDRVPGTTTRMSVAADGSESNGLCGSVSISPDGAYAAFHANADNLVTSDTNGQQDVFFTTW